MQSFTPGVYDIENHDYHEADGLSRSGLILFNKSPLHYWNEYKKETAQETDNGDTPALILGNAVHSYILEPDKFNERFFVAEKVDRRTTVGKEKWQAMQAQLNGRDILTEESFQQVQNMGKSFLSNSIASRFLEGAQIEKSIFWKDSKTNVLCKCRPDIWLPNILCDLKTTEDASPRAFQRDMIKYGYHIQAAMIQDGIHHIKSSKIETFVFICIEKSDPYAIGIYELDKEAIERGREEYKKILEDYMPYQYEEVKIWPGYKPAVISLPAYYY